MSGNFKANADAAVAALMGWYNTASGLWDTTGWWNSANALEAVIDYSLRTNTTTYQDLISNTFLKNKDFNPFRLINVNANFLNGYYDDEGWWALAWIKAYDLTGIGDYLNMAETIFADMTKGWDQFCQGGIMWKKWDGPLWKEFKNAIANELFLTVAARLYQRTSNQSYLNWAQKEWNWFSTSGMIGQQTDSSKNQVKNMINDGLDQTTCASSGLFYTYNQGVILGGLVDLYKITGDSSLLSQAWAIADAVLNSFNNPDPNTRLVNSAGILTEVCESTNTCGEDGPQFKGIFMRNLSYLFDTNPPKVAYKNFIINNANAIWNYDRNGNNQCGLKWAGPLDNTPNAATQASALDALIAALTGFYVNEDWTHGAYYGSRGTYFADVTGDGKADAIVVNDDKITVRRSTGSGFSSTYESWTNEPYYGSVGVGTYFADVTGDGKADAIVVNKDKITVRRSTGGAFSPTYESWTSDQFFGSRGTYFADVDGDGRADAIAVTDTSVLVRRSTGSGFGPVEDWTHGAYYGSRGTFFADVTGDSRADAIVVNDNTVTVRRAFGV